MLIKTPVKISDHARNNMSQRGITKDEVFACLSRVLFYTSSRPHPKHSVMKDGDAVRGCLYEEKVKTPFWEIRGE